VSKKKIFNTFWNLSLSQKTAVVICLFLLLALPLGIIVSLNPIGLFSKAQSSTPSFFPQRCQRDTDCLVPKYPGYNQPCKERKCLSGYCIWKNKPNRTPCFTSNGREGICRNGNCESSSLPTPSIHPLPSQTPTVVTPFHTTAPPLSQTPTLPLSTPTLAPGTGAYQIILNNSQTTLTCVKNDPNCYYQSTFQAINRTGQPLYNTTLYTNSPYKTLTFIGFDGNWTSETSKTNLIIQPGQAAINTLVKVVPPPYAGEWLSSLCIDGQTCNTNVNPPDCYFYGGSCLNVKITVTE